MFRTEGLIFPVLGALAATFLVNLVVSYVCVRVFEHVDSIG